MSSARDKGTMLDHLVLPNLDEGSDKRPVPPPPLSPPPVSVSSSTKNTISPPDWPAPPPLSQLPEELLRARDLAERNKAANILPEPSKATSQPEERAIVKLRRLITEKKFGDIPLLLASKELTSEMLLEKDDKSNKGKLLLQTVLLSGNRLLFKEIIESPKCTEEVLGGTDNDGNTVLHFAALADLFPQFAQMILSRPACTEKVIAKQNNESKTALHLACSKSTLDCMRVFMQEPKCNESAIVIGDADENTVLHYAVLTNNLELFFLLLISGKISDRVLNKKNNKGLTAFYQAVDLSEFMNMALTSKPVQDDSQADARLKMVKGFAHLNNMTEHALEYRIFDSEKHDKFEDIGGYRVLEQMLLNGDQAKATTSAIKRELALLFIHLAREDLILIANGLSLRNEKNLKPKIEHLCNVVMELSKAKLSTNELIDVALLLKKCKEAIQDPAKYSDELEHLIDKVRRINRRWAKVLVQALCAVVSGIVFAVSMSVFNGLIGFPTFASSQAIANALLEWAKQFSNQQIASYLTGGVAAVSLVVSGASTFFAYRGVANGKLGQSADNVLSEIKKVMK